MSVTSVIIELPECEECGSRMKFFDQVWIEDEYMLVASILCVNPQCVNSSAVYIQAAQQSVQPTDGTHSDKSELSDLPGDTVKLGGKSTIGG